MPEPKITPASALSRPPTTTVAAKPKIQPPPGTGTGTEGDGESDGDGEEEESLAEGESLETEGTGETDSIDALGTPKTEKSIPSSALKARLEQERARVRRQVLSELGITGDIASFKADLKNKTDQLTKLQNEEQKRARQKMTDAQKLESDLKTRDAAIAELKAKIDHYEMQERTRSQDAQIGELASGVVAADMLEPALLMYKQTIIKMHEQDPESTKDIGPEDVTEWFKDLVKKQPRFAKTPEEIKEAKATIKRKAISDNSKAPNKPPVNGSNGQTHVEKTPRPGLPNSMNATELREFLAKQNIQLRHVR